MGAVLVVGSRTCIVAVFHPGPDDMAVEIQGIEIMGTLSVWERVYSSFDGPQHEAEIFVELQRYRMSA